MERISTFKDYVGELTVTYRRTKKLTSKIQSPKEAADYIRPYFDVSMDDHEECKVIHLNNGNHVVNVHQSTCGSETGTIIDIKGIVRNALHIKTCLLYTSDAADDLLCVDLG